MLTFLVITAIALMLAGLAAVAIPLLVIGALLWLLLLPIKLVFGLVVGRLFRFVFGIVGALLGLLFIPVALVVGGVALLAALISGVFALLVPLVPIVLLVLLAWGVFRLVRPNARTTGQYFTF